MLIMIFISGDQRVEVHVPSVDVVTRVVGTCLCAVYVHVYVPCSVSCLFMPSGTFFILSVPIFYEHLFSIETFWVIISVSAFKF